MNCVLKLINETRKNAAWTAEDQQEGASDRPYSYFSFYNSINYFIAKRTLDPH